MNELIILISSLIICSYILTFIFMYIYKNCNSNVINVSYEIIDKEIVLYKGVFHNIEYLKNCSIFNLSKNLNIKNNELICPTDENKICDGLLFILTFIFAILSFTLYELYLFMNKLIKIEVDTSHFTKKDKLYNHILD
jgi:hypothetical protein